MRTLLGLLLTIAVLTTACSAPVAAAAYIDIAPATIGAEDSIPAPTGTVVLTVGGEISKSNVGSTVELDMATIEQMGLVRYVVHDPWLDQDLEFTGVLLSTFLATVGASRDATTVAFRALDDYEVEISTADIERWPIVLATQTNGKAMSLEDKGPTRVVFPYDQYPEIDQLRYKDLWIWQLATIEIR